MDVNEKYLGIKILQPAHMCSTYIEKMETKLAGWKLHSLSRVGRMQLIRSVLALIPVYFMATSMIPVQVET